MVPLGYTYWNLELEPEGLNPHKETIFT